MRLDTAVDKFMVTRTTSGYAHNTLKNNRAHLKLLIQNLPADITVGRISADRFEEAWRAIGVGRSPNNMANTLATYNTFFKWCHNRHLVPARWRIPTTDVRPPKPQKRERFRVPVSEFGTLLDATTSPRDRALLTSSAGVPGGTVPLLLSAGGEGYEGEAGQADPRQQAAPRSRRLRDWRAAVMPLEGPGRHL